MKITEILFDRVRDCPHCIDGSCNHKKTKTGECKTNGLAEPPDDCPCDDAF